MEKLIVVYCPGEYHSNYRTSEGMLKKRILGFVEPSTKGAVYMQCGNRDCRRSHGEDYNGMYKVGLNGSMGVTATLVPRKNFEIIELPYVTHKQRD